MENIFTDSQWESYNVQGYTPPHNVDFSGNWYPNGTNAGKDMYVDSNNKFGLFNDSRSNRRNFWYFYPIDHTFNWVGTNLGIARLTNSIFSQIPLDQMLISFLSTEELVI